MNDNSCFNLLIYLGFIVVLIKVVPVLISVVREINSTNVSTSDSLPSKHLLHQIKLGTLLGMLVGSFMVVIGTIFGDTKSLMIIGGSIFFFCLAGSGYSDIRLNQIETKLTAWGGIILFSIIGFSLLIWGIILLTSS